MDDNQIKGFKWLKEDKLLKALIAFILISLIYVLFCLERYIINF
ncbi:hypothetical protein BBU64B_D0005 (plasmid) [Borreliella burgdorferi 64b]|nr:hypothetical protein BBU64B_D0005 [Borreliella burgdorferi 64b]